MTKVAVLDYGMGNLHSVAKALEHVGADVVITNTPKEIDSADKILFPGVGAMRDCMQGMAAASVDEAVRRNVFNKPVMAICVGMQALFSTAEENDGVDCLDIFSGNVVKFADNLVETGGDQLIKVPHMGWNTVQQVNPEHALWQGIEQDSRFYFVHSFYCEPDISVATQADMVAATCDYGVQFTCSVLKDNLFATQFHPEKSHNAGLQLLKNFVEWDI